MAGNIANVNLLPVQTTIDPGAAFVGNSPTAGTVLYPASVVSDSALIAALGVGPGRYDVLSALNYEVDSRLLGLGSMAALPMFNTIDDTDAIYIRNPECWLAGIPELTAISVWNNLLDHQGGANLISPQHVAYANHFTGPGGGQFPYTPGVTQFRWVDLANNVYQRTLMACTEIGGTDIVIGVLDSPLPASITPFHIPSPSWVNSVPTSPYQYGLPFVGVEVVSALFQAVVQEFTGFVPPAYGGGAPINAQRNRFYTSAQPGNSGQAVMLLNNGHLSLLWSAHYSDRTGTPLYDNVDAINAFMALQGGQYSLILDVYPAYPLLSNAVAIQAPYSVPGDAFGHVPYYDPLGRLQAIGVAIGAGYVELQPQSAAPAHGLSNTVRAYSDVAGRFGFVDGVGGLHNILDGGYKAITAKYSPTAHDSIVYCNASGGPFPVTLPTASGYPGQQLAVKRTDGTSNSVTINSSGGSIDGSSSYVLSGNAYPGVRVASDGAAWWILNKL